MSNPYMKYKKTQIESASREQLLLLMYEGAIRFLKKAMIAMDNNDIAERGLNIGKAYDVVMELNNTLNHEVGGDIAINLEQLYMFMTDRLTHANIHNDKQALEEVLKLLTTLHDGWKQAIELLKRGESAVAEK